MAGDGAGGATVVVVEVVAVVDFGVVVFGCSKRTLITFERRLALFALSQTLRPTYIVWLMLTPCNMASILSALPGGFGEVSDPLIKLLLFNELLVPKFSVRFSMLPEYRMS